MPVLALMGVGGAGSTRPFVLSAEIDDTGTVLTVVWSVPVLLGGGDLTLTVDGSPATLTYTSGSGTNTWIYAITNGH